MSIELSPQTIEQLPDHLQFMSVDAINDFRAQQHDDLVATRKEYEDRVSQENLFDGSLAKAYDAGEAAAKDAAYQSSEDYVAAHFDKDNNPELFDDLVIALSLSSIHYQNSTEWFIGQKDGDGTIIPRSAGKDKLADYMLILAKQYSPDVEPNTPTDSKENDPPEPKKPKEPPIVPTPPTPPVIPAPPIAPIAPKPSKEDLTQQANYEALDSKVADLRNKTAELSVERRRRTHNRGKKRGNLQRDFDQANDQYQAAFQELATLELQKSRKNGSDEDQIRVDAFKSVINEHGAFTAAEWKLIHEDHSLRGRFARFIAKSNKRMFAASAASGAVLGATAHEVTRNLKSSVAIGVLGGLAAGGLVVAGALRGSLRSVVKSGGNQIVRHQARQNEDLATLEEKLNTVRAGSVDEYYTSSSELLRSVISDRVAKDQRINKREVIIGAAAGAAGGLVGALGAYGVHAAIDKFFDVIDTPKVSIAPIPLAKVPPIESVPDMPSIDRPNGGENAPKPNKGIVDGFKININVENGNGYTQELQDLAAQKDISLSGAESYELYQHLEGKFGTNMMVNEDSYGISGGDHGISNPGGARWNPQAIHEMQRWLEENDKVKTS